MKVQRAVCLGFQHGDQEITEAFRGMKVQRTGGAAASTSNTEITEGTEAFRGTKVQRAGDSSASNFQHGDHGRHGVGGDGVELSGRSVVEFRRQGAPSIAALVVERLAAKPLPVLHVALSQPIDSAV